MTEEETKPPNVEQQKQNWLTARYNKHQKEKIKKYKEMLKLRHRISHSPRCVEKVSTRKFYFDVTKISDIQMRNITQEAKSDLPKTGTSLLINRVETRDENLDSVRTGESLVKYYDFNTSRYNSDTDKCVAFWRTIMKEEDFQPVKCTLVKLQFQKSNVCANKCTEKGQRESENGYIWYNALLELQRRKMDELALASNAQTCKLCDQEEPYSEFKKRQGQRYTESELKDDEDITCLNYWSPKPKPKCVNVLNAQRTQQSDTAQRKTCKCKNQVCFCNEEQTDLNNYDYTTFEPPKLSERETIEKDESHVHKNSISASPNEDYILPKLNQSDTAAERKICECENQVCFCNEEETDLNNYDYTTFEPPKLSERETIEKDESHVHKNSTSASPNEDYILPKLNQSETAAERKICKCENQVCFCNEEETDLDNYDYTTFEPPKLFEMQTIEKDESHVHKNSTSASPNEDYILPKLTQSETAAERKICECENQMCFCNEEETDLNNYDYTTFEPPKLSERETIKKDELHVHKNSTSASPTEGYILPKLTTQSETADYTVFEPPKLSERGTQESDSARESILESSKDESSEQFDTLESFQEKLQPNKNSCAKECTCGETTCMCDTDKQQFESNMLTKCAVCNKIHCHCTKHLDKEALQFLDQLKYRLKNIQKDKACITEAVGKKTAEPKRYCVICGHNDCNCRNASNQIEPKFFQFIHFDDKEKSPPLTVNERITTIIHEKAQEKILSKVPKTSSSVLQKIMSDHIKQSVCHPDSKDHIDVKILETPKTVASAASMVHKERHSLQDEKSKMLLNKNVVIIEPNMSNKRLTSLEDTCNDAPFNTSNLEKIKGTPSESVTARQKPMCWYSSQVPQHEDFSIVSQKKF